MAGAMSSIDAMRRFHAKFAQNFVFSLTRFSTQGSFPLEVGEKKRPVPDRDRPVQT
jgi:hypothetical protein